MLSCTAIHSFGQSFIKGRITDGQKTVPSVTILLLRATDSTLVRGVVADSTGEFLIGNIAAGNYKVAVSMIGYSRFLSPAIQVAGENIVLSDIMLEEATTQLGEVVVKAEKPLFEQQIDRLVVNIQSSITTSGNTVLDVLQKLPGVVVNRQNNTITMNGKSGLRVMINGKIMPLPLDVVVQMLDGMNASNLEKIELITTPPSKYDAEGNAGIIHLVTKERAEYGTNGSFGLTVGYKWAETLGGNFSLHHRTEKLAWFVDYSFMRTHNLHRMDMDRQSTERGFAQSVTDHSHRENITHQQNVNAGAEWKIKKNTTLNLLFTGYRNKWTLKATTDDRNQVTVDSTVSTTMKIHESNIWQSATGSMELQTKPGPKSEISFSLDYLYYHNHNPSSYDNATLYEQPNRHEASNIDLLKNTPIRILMAKADYHYISSSSLTLEAGVKATTSKLNNDVAVQRLENKEWVIDSIFTSYSTLREQLGAAYVAANWQLGKNWQLNSGLRYEYTHTLISTPTQQRLIDRTYGYLFPTLFLKKELTKEKDVQVSYSRRITRPTYNDMAPFVFFWSPTTFSAGNISLWPAISDAIRLGYHASQWLVSLQFSHTKKEIINLFQPEKDSQSNKLIFRSQNLKYLNTLSLTNTYSFQLSPWWKIQSNLTMHYQVAQTEHLAHNMTLHVKGLNFNLTNLLKLPKDITVEISGFYQSRSLFGISAFLPYGSLNTGIQKKFGTHGIVKLSMDDMLYTNIWKIKTNLPNENLYSTIFYDWHNQFVRLTYSRNLGNSGLRSVKLKSGSNEERGRITN
jgi:hypothetical protein